MAEKRSKVVVLGTGGTIAGWAPDPSQGRQYQAGELRASDLVLGLGVEQDHIVTEEVARIDSKNMDWPVWQSLVARVQHWLDQDDVQGVVVTHGTDTLEETAILLHTLFSGHKTVVITGAMRAANVPDPDGPANLRHALALAGAPGSAGVVCVFAGQVHAAASLTKVDCQALNAFGSVDPVALDTALHDKRHPPSFYPPRPWRKFTPGLGWSWSSTMPHKTALWSKRCWRAKHHPKAGWWRGRETER